MNYAEMSVPGAQTTARVAVSVANASTPVTAAAMFVTVTAGCFICKSAAAVAQTSMYLAPNIPYKLRGLKEGDTLNFITAVGTADAYVTADT